MCDRTIDEKKEKRRREEVKNRRQEKKMKIHEGTETNNKRKLMINRNS